MSTYNKVTLDGTTLMDISDSTAVATDVAQGKTFYLADGTKATGSASGGGVNVKTGTYTPTQTYNSSGNRAIVTVSDIGFTPSRFVLYVDNINDISTTQYAIIRSTFETYGSTDYYVRNTVRFSDASGSVGSTANKTSWTTQANYLLYLNNGTIYYRTSNTYTLIKSVKYIWEAYE